MDRRGISRFARNDGCVGLGEVEGALKGTLFGFDFLLELENGVKNSFGARRAAGNVDVDGDDLIAALDDSVIVEDAAGSGARAHGDDPLGLGHLIVELTDDRSHFLGEATGNNHKVGLAGRRTKHFGAEASDIETRGGHGHHFDGAAGEAKAQRPDGTLAGPIHGLVELREDDAFVLQELAEIIGFRERDVFTQSGFHTAYFGTGGGGRQIADSEGG